MEYINKKVNEYKEEDGYLYALYGTPAENLCGLQVKQFRKKYGVVANVSDKGYVSNSFHCHVSENIGPIQKQLERKRLFMLKAGFARLDITPPFGNPLAGYFTKRSLSGILDPIEINAVAVSDGENTALLMAVDFIGVDKEHIYQFPLAFISYCTLSPIMQIYTFVFQNITYD